MKKSFVIILVLVLLTSCAKVPESEETSKVDPTTKSSKEDIKMLKAG